MIYCILISLAVVALDQISKLLVLKFIDLGEIVPCIKGVFHLTYINNDGAAFGILQNHRWVFMVISVLAIAAIYFYIAKEKPKSPWVRTSLAFIAGGGIGNMIDRIFRGTVIDFIDFDFVNFYVFNIADAFVTVGCAVLVCYMLFVELPKDSKKKKLSAGASADTKTDGAEPGCENTEAASPDKGGCPCCRADKDTSSDGDGKTDETDGKNGGDGND